MEVLRRIAAVGIAIGAAITVPLKLIDGIKKDQPMTIVFSSVGMILVVLMVVETIKYLRRGNNQVRGDKHGRQKQPPDSLQ